MRTRANVRVMWCVVAILVAFSAGAAAGEYYLSDEDAYWWYWGGTPNFEVKIPSSAYAYVQSDWGGTTSLQVAVDQRGPLIIVGTMPGTDVNRAWNALSARWGVTVSDSRTTTSSTIQTDKGLQASFRVLEGRTGNGPNAMVRMVAFTRGDRLAYLLFVGNANTYTGATQQFWLRAVHSFDWRT